MKTKIEGKRGFFFRGDRWKAREIARERKRTTG